jgi:hypothetical protein
MGRQAFPLVELALSDSRRLRLARVIEEEGFQSVGWRQARFGTNLEPTTGSDCFYLSLSGLRKEGSFFV